MRISESIYSIILLAIVMTGITIASAQVPTVRKSSTGKIKGTIFDPTGAVIQKAKIRFENKNFKREINSDENGKYEIELPIGTYLVTAEMAGFHLAMPRKFYIGKNRIIENNYTLIGIKNDPDHP